MRRSVSFFVALALAGLMIAPGAEAASSSASISAGAWQRTAAPTAARSGARAAVRPERFQALTLDRAALAGVLAEAPPQSAVADSGSLTISLPTPTGDFERFAIQRSSVMEPGLAARHPEISTYSGTGIDVPGSTVHLDLGSLGLHASVIGPDGAWYVDPYYHREQSAYASYFGRDLPNTHGSFVERDGPLQLDPLSDFGAQAQAAPSTVQLRNYRLALASDPSYAQYFGAANVTSAKVALINRVNQAYEGDLDAHLVLVADNDKLNFDTAKQMTKPNGPCGTAACYKPQQIAFCSGATLVRNDTVIGQVIGAGNYDIGHIALGVNGGGIAALGVVGRRHKAEGCTGVPTPEGDLYAIDYVAHEMGHQFGGNHTFNGKRFNCGFGNRNQTTSVEPGSGSTIMAYAGICGSDDLQPHSDPYFSERSIQEIGHYVGSAQPPADEVQSVALRKFDTDGDSFTLTYNGATSEPIVRGTNYDAASIQAAIESIAGGTESVVAFGGSAGEPNDDGFQVTFGGTLSGHATAQLRVTNTEGASGFVGEIVRGGPVQNGGSSIVNTPNHAPVVTAPHVYQIPVRTPFSLTGSSTDADNDPVTYSWEQNDDGAGSGTPLTRNAKRSGPLFRQFGTAAQVTAEGTLMSPSPGENATTPDPTRVFPDMAQIVAGHTNAETGECPAAVGQGPFPQPTVDCYSEFLPTKDWVGIGHDRTMHFRLTARDGNPVAGGVAHDNTRVKIVPKAGPFRITSQSAPQTVDGGSQLAVSWDIAGTASAPLKVSQVSIRLSLNGGRTFPIPLAGATPNDGTESVTLPNVAAPRARVMVQAVGNVFFDVSHANLRINFQGHGG